MQIYLARNNQQAGPYSLEQVNQMLASQQVLLTDLAWHQGMSEWKTLGELTQGKLVYEPVDHTPVTPAPTWAERNITTSTATPSHATVQDTTQFASIPARILAKLMDVFLWLPATYILTAFFSPEEAQKFTQANEKMYNLIIGGATDASMIQQLQSEIVGLIPSQAWTAMFIYLAVMLALQAYLLATSGQSIGKKLTRIKIVDASSSDKVGLTRIFLLRSIVFVILNLLIVPLISIFDAIFALGKNRQALHDKLAKTKVIKQ